MKAKALFIAFLLLVVGRTAAAQGTWSVSQASVSGGTSFTITRSDATKQQWVLCRTNGYSAMAEKHFTSVNQVLEFAAGESSKTVTVTETPIEDVELRYRYQGGVYRKYSLDVLDENGGLLASTEKDIVYGAAYRFQNINVSKSISDLVYMADRTYEYEGYPVVSDKAVRVNYEGEYLAYRFDNEVLYYYDYIDEFTKYGDLDEQEKPRSISTAALFPQGSPPGEYHSLIGNKMYATVFFQVRDYEDGYRYIQVVAGNDTEYDTDDDPDGAVIAPSKSVYKACFESYKNGSTVDDHWRWQMFPHKYDYVNREEEQTHNVLHSNFSGKYGYLYQQGFKNESFRASSSGSLKLDPAIPFLMFRFDAGGGGYDTDRWYYANLSVALALEDAQAPDLWEARLTPGIYLKGNTATIALSFTETVKTSGTVVLNTTWGDFTAQVEPGNSTNVIRFTGTIDADPGTELAITGLTGNISDLIGNAFTYSAGTHTLNSASPYTVANTYTITYMLDGGTVSGNPATYSDKSLKFTLNAPVRLGYTFVGWRCLSQGQDIIISDGVIRPGTRTTGYLPEQTGNLTLVAQWQADPSLTLTARQASFAGQTRYWTSFYHPLNYTLPAGAKAYVMDSNNVLYLLGDGSAIPAESAVVIIAEASALTDVSNGEGTLTLTKVNKIMGLSSAIDNKLSGTSADTATSSLVTGTKKVYVLGQDGGNVGFFEFSGTVPANKAYYVE